MSAAGLRLSARYTKKASYEEMFLECTKLTEGPDMSSLQFVGEEACKKMFNKCSVLVKAPDMLQLVEIWVQYDVFHLSQTGGVFSNAPTFFCG